MTIEELKTAHKAYMLRTCNADMTSYNGFVWPKEGHVLAPDWNPDGLLSGQLYQLDGDKFVPAQKGGAQ